MKFIISFFLMGHVFGSPINVYHEMNMSEARIYKDIFQNDYNIPEDLIEIKITGNCEGQKSNGKIDLCLKNNGDLYVVSVDRKFIDESLKVFTAP